MGSGGVGATVSSLLTRYSVSGDSDDEEDQHEEEELVQDDDEQDVNENSHTRLPKEVVRAPSPRRRQRGAVVWKHIHRITKYNVLYQECVIIMEHIRSSRTFQEVPSTFKCDV